MSQMKLTISVWVMGVGGRIMFSLHDVNCTLLCWVS